MRIIGIDFGERRIGVAAADDRTRVAVPLRTIDVTGDPVGALARLLDDERAEQVVIGLPLSLTGAEGSQAKRVREVIDALARRTMIQITTWDERLTTAQAARLGRGGAGRRSGKGKSVAEDSIAAAILLQAYVDSLRPYG